MEKVGLKEFWVFRWLSIGEEYVKKLINKYQYL